MKNTLRTKSSNINIINFVMILGVFVFLTMGCQQISDAVNSNKTTNTNTATNSNSNANSNASSNANANSNANSNVTANSNANAKNQTAEKPPEVKAFENNLAGTWVSDNEKLIFGPDRYLRYKNGKLAYNDAYRAVDKENIEYRTGEFRKGKSKITFENGNATLVWTDPYGQGGTYKRESNDSNLSVGNSLRDKLIGNWVGIAGTNSEKQNLSIFSNTTYYYSSEDYWYSFPSEGIWSSYTIAVKDDKTVDLKGVQNEKNGTPSNIQIKASVDGNVMSVEENGVTKKFNRQTTVD